MKTSQQLWFRFAILASAFVVVVWMVSSTLTFVLFQSRLQEALDSSLELSAGQALAAVNVEDGTLNLTDSIPDLSSLGTVLEGGFLVQIFDPAGKLVLSSGKMDVATTSSLPRSDKKVLFSSDPNTPGDRQFRAISVPVLVNSHRVGTIRIFRGTASVQNALDRLLTTLLFVLPFFIVTTFLGSAWIARRSLSPVDRMIDQAARISDTNLSQRLAYTGREDEVGRLAQVFNALLSRLESAFDKEKRFTADAAHELRTPLNAIQAILGTTLARHRDDELYRKALTDIGQQVNRLTSLANDLLFLAREPSRTVEETFDIALLVEDVVAGLEPLAHEKGLSLETSARGPVLMVGDRDSVARAFFNIVGNAVRYTNHGRVTVSLAEAVESGQVVEVLDTGIGISPEHLPHLFERFYRGSSSRTDGGAGLGLALAQEIVARHRGRLEVESVVGRGSIFRVIFPIAKNL